MKTSISTAALLLFSTLTSACIYKRAAEGEAEWSYTGATGPLLWHTLSSNNSECATGHNQSPTNVQTSSYAQLHGLDIHFPSSGNFKFENNGHTVQATPQDGEYSLNIGDKQYQLAQFHFHTPSEHRLDETSYPLEVHFVHKSTSDELAVVGVFFDLRARSRSAFTSKLASALGDVEKKHTETEVEDLELRDVERHIQHSDVYNYDGSLTTPPCKEGVKWYVVKDPIEIDQRIERKFREVMKFNSRFTQNAPGEKNLLELASESEH